MATLKNQYDEILNQPIFPPWNLVKYFNISDDHVKELKVKKPFTFKEKQKDELLGHKIEKYLNTNLI
jgi:hypothetical protein